jgi:hypothetical protein
VLAEVKKLFFDGVAYVLDGFTDLTSSFAKSFLDFAARSISSAFSFKIAIIDGLAYRFFGFAFGLIQFSFYFVSVR